MIQAMSKEKRNQANRRRRSDEMNSADNPPRKPYGHM